MTRNYVGSRKSAGKVTFYIRWFRSLRFLQVIKLSIPYCGEVLPVLRTTYFLNSSYTHFGQTLYQYRLWVSGRTNDDELRFLRPETLEREQDNKCILQHLTFRSSPCNFTKAKLAAYEILRDACIKLLTKIRIGNCIGQESTTFSSWTINPFCDTLPNLETNHFFFIEWFELKGLQIIFARHHKLTGSAFLIK